MAMCFSLLSSRSAAARMNFSASSFCPLACAIQADAANIWISTCVGPIGLASPFPAWREVPLSLFDLAVGGGEIAAAGRRRWRGRNR